MLQNLYRTNKVIKYLGSNDPARGLMSCTLSYAVFQNFVRELLLERGYRVQIWTTEGRSGRQWRPTRQASPGNLQDLEDMLFSNTEMESSPIVLALRLKTTAEEKMVGVAFANASVREIGFSEFLDNDIYSNLESLLIQLGVKECIMQVDEQRKDYELGVVRGIVDRCGVVITERNVKQQQQDTEMTLTQLIKPNSPPLPEQRDLALSAAAALIQYLGVMHDASNHGQYTLAQHDLSAYMKLDASALRALNLMPSAKDGANRSMSIYGLLNRCKTAMGSRLLSQWLKQPLLDNTKINQRLRLVQAFVDNVELRQSLQEDLKAIPDLYRLAKRFQRGIANLEDVVRAYQVVIRLPGFIDSLQTLADEDSLAVLTEEYTAKLQDASLHLAKLQDLVETTIDLEALDEHRFVIKASFDENLQVIQAHLEKLKEDMAREHSRVGTDLEQDTEKRLKLEQHHVYNWCFRLTRNEASCIRGRKGYTELSTQKAGVYFKTSTLDRLSSEFVENNRRYQRHQSGLVTEVVSITASYCPLLLTLASIISHLDVILSFAHISVHAPSPYVKPKILDKEEDRRLYMKNARHPCLEAQDNITFITNDVEMNSQESEFLIVTGPNMGGKSTFIRMVGVISLMAQVGCFVPCDDAELSVVDCILARVGAGDSQLKGLSTFMSEMLETATILKTATANSLIIIDELGRGTSTYDGFGLAWAISEHILTRINSFALFATHFHELTALADDHSQVKNLHVVAHIGDQNSSDRGITLLYKVAEGVCDQSFGIHVAELAKFPEKVVKMAKRKADELEDFSNKHDKKRMVWKCTSKDVEKGSKLLKKVLLDWQQQVRGQKLQDRDEIVGLFKRLITETYRADLLGDLWIQETGLLQHL